MIIDIGLVQTKKSSFISILILFQSIADVPLAATERVDAYCRLATILLRAKITLLPQELVQVRQRESGLLVVLRTWEEAIIIIVKSSM